MCQSMHFHEANMQAKQQRNDKIVIELELKEDTQDIAYEMTQKQRRRPSSFQRLLHEM